MPRHSCKTKSTPKQTNSLYQTIVSTLHNLGYKEQAKLLQIKHHWRKAVGVKIAARTTIHSFKGGVLTIKTASSAWQNELTFLKNKILKQLNQLLGEKLVHELKTLSSIPHFNAESPAPAPVSNTLPVKPTKEDQTIAKSTAAVIEDQEVRAALVNLIAKSRARNRLLQ